MSMASMAGLPVLLRWLKEAKPDVVCLQELKAPQEKFPEQAIKERVIMPSGMDKKAGTAWPYCRAWVSPKKSRSALPGDPEDMH